MPTEDHQKDLLAVVSSCATVKFRLDCLQDFGQELVLNHILLLAQDGGLQQVVHLLVPGHLQHGQHNQVPIPILGQSDNGHVRLVTGHGAHLLYEGCLGAVCPILQGRHDNRVSDLVCGQRGNAANELVDQTDLGRW